MKDVADMKELLQEFEEINHDHDLDTTILVKEYKQWSKDLLQGDMRQISKDKCKLLEQEISDREIIVIIFKFFKNFFKIIIICHQDKKRF